MSVLLKAVWLFDEWFEYYDEKKGRPYFYNKKTQQTTWTKPVRASMIIQNPIPNPVEVGSPTITITKAIDQPQRPVLPGPKPILPHPDSKPTMLTLGLETKLQKPKKSIEKVNKPEQWAFADKQGGGIKTWNTRYFVLWTNGDLAYYKMTKSTSKELLDFSKAEQKGKFNVKGCNFRTERIKGHENSIVLETEGRDFVMSFHDEKTCVDFKDGLVKVGLQNSILIEGLAEKQGQKIKSWQERTFVLYKSLELEYWADKDLKGTFDVSGCKFRVMKGLKSCLEIEMKNGRMFLMSFARDDIMSKWKKVFVDAGLTDATPLESRVLFSGYIDKLGEKVKNWTNRCFVIYSDGLLEYYKNVPTPKEFKKGEMKGSFSLKGTSFKVAKLQNETFFLTIESANRDFYLHVKDPYLVEQFKSAITESGSRIIQTTRKSDSALFGLPLADVMKRKEETESIPHLIAPLFELLEYYGPRWEGIFRISIEKETLDRFIARLDNQEWVDFQSEVKGDEAIAHTLACILKRYIRELPDSLLTFELYDSFLQTIAITNEESKISTLCSLVKQVPTHNYDLLKKLFELCTIIEANSAVNRMNAHNLAVVFGIGILKSRDEMKTTMDVGQIQKVFTSLLGLYKMGKF